MNLITVAKPNSKGQIVIPKKFREELKINENTYLNLVLNGKGVLITPLNKWQATSDSNKIFLEILKRTAGTWSGDDWKETEKREEK